MSTLSLKISFLNISPCLLTSIDNLLFGVPFKSMESSSTFLFFIDWLSTEIIISPAFKPALSAEKSL